ncbi:zinc finger BED domain-containing protein RICESLEEPER 2-like [Coffea arabica]|uniref:Zinc finger BED domain-containing protein RICESLEEPER 2-like n=1 Tax=Coffea arabica TaxID=13443 RepID=A0ABM4WPM8_COFAR
MVQHGLDEIADIIENIRESVEFVNRFDIKRLPCAEIAQQLQIPNKILIRDCRTRWNSAFKMLSCAIKFKEVFPRFQDREPQYDCCPSIEDWNKVEKVCNILETFWIAMHIISSNAYPTSNLFLREIFKVKTLLDSKENNEDDFI